jgi:hypothetical protein
MSHAGSRHPVLLDCIKPRLGGSYGEIRYGGTGAAHGATVICPVVTLR